jgi:hypothetical protein
MRRQTLALCIGLVIFFVCVVVLPPTVGWGQDSPSVLFVRGADRSGGFLEANNDADRTEHLADINNASTAGGNHGWNALRRVLEGAGFIVSQIVEPLEAGAPSAGQTTGQGIAFELLSLNEYDVVVFGSNNAVYSTSSVDAVENYIRGGGGAIFISDANFGSDWADASNSDQQFLDRFGLIAHQDQGTYSIQRSAGDFLIPDHPIFDGVDRFDGEGVTPIEVGTPTAGVSLSILALSEGQTRLNNGSGGNNRGSSRTSGPNDAALLYADVDQGRIIGHFDRNTFFNQNGAGTNINRFDNTQFAINLFTVAAGPRLTELLFGDVDQNGFVDFGDIAPFIAVLGSGDFQIEADCDQNGVVNFLDISPFIGILMRR